MVPHQRSLANHCAYQVAECPGQHSEERLAASLVQVDDHHGASPCAVVSELDDSGPNGAGYLANLLQAVR